MRFAIEEINNSSTLLPNITLGYHIIDHCTDTHNFPDILHLFSANGSAKVMQIFKHYHSQVISFIGAFSSTETITLAPMFMTDLIPMVSYGASSSTLSDKLVYPSFIRTTPSNKNQIELIIHIIKHFGWNWVAFIGSKSEYSENGFQVFFEMIKNTGICLGYQERLDDKTELNTTFHRIDTLQINVIILFIEELFAEKIITSSVQLNVHNKVWIASDSWSMSNYLLKLQGIKTIGTIIGVTPTVVPLPGFNEFIYQSQHRADFVHSAEDFCNQACDNCSSVSPEDVINENPTYNFPVYSAVYTIAMALHNVLQCNHSGCNYTDLYSCLKCDQYEWSEAGSTSCQKCSVEYLHFSDGYSIVLMVFASSFMLLCLGVAVLFAMHRSTPVVRSAGGSMCFLMLGCFAASATSVFFYFDKPTSTNCMVRNIVYAFFYTVCQSCLFVRSFQIICIFKMAAHLPKAHAWWMKYNGQWLVVAALSLLQLLSCTVWMATSPPLPVEKYSFKYQVVLLCLVSDMTTACLCNGLMWILSGLCFWFSYMGKDLPKNYNEAKAITFGMVLFCLSWAAYITAYVLSHSKYIQVVKIVVELSCLYGILFCYFIPKSFIIVFQPQKNTQEYFQNAIQSYTKNISRM
ncbi:taste receptor type 1 member 1-like [Alosa pseudoharengus]|uniref:taste receptor type 1 member 1-like n=1 Tax=Alosa pseudoharengus TaxID=34774 RepID=UPI003F89131C